MEILICVFTIILGFGVIIGFIFFIDDKSGKQERIVGISILIPSIIGIIVFFISMLKIDLSYKRGQIDALTNNIKYELKENSDKTKEWVEIKKK